MNRTASAGIDSLLSHKATVGMTCQPRPALNFFTSSSKHPNPASKLPYPDAVQ